MGLFPYDKIRPEQDILLDEIASALEKRKNLILHAPTGLGKTAAALAPCLEFALKKNLAVFFLTSRHTQHAIAVETLRKIMEKHNLKFNTADLVGKKNMCLQEGISELRQAEFHEYCKKLREDGTCLFYSNTRHGQKNTAEAEKAVGELKSLGPIHTEEVNEKCRSCSLCPYEIAALLARESSVIICDYSYIFNPIVSASLFNKIQKALNNCIVIIDEAHNLPKRVADYATEKLSMFILKRAAQECNKYKYNETAVKLASLMDSLDKFAENIKDEKLIKKDEFIDMVNEIEDYERLINELNGIADDIREKQKQSFTGSVAEFLEAWPGEDNGFARVLKKKDKNIMLNYKCLDASLITKGIIANTYCTIAMSGTLTPTYMYKDLLGFENAVEKEFRSPFPDENKLSLIVPNATTRYTERNEMQFKKIADSVASITNAVPGNTLVLFPSYAIRDNVFRHFTDKSSKTSFLETADMNKKEKYEMLERFKLCASSGAVLLGANSGNFAEGIDLMGDLLKCVVIVGLPLQQPDLETKEAIKYFDSKFGKGWDYGYIFPAFNKVLQGAGRCIRSETDRGVVVFLDERYAWPNYIRCFPEDLNLKIEKDYIKEIKKFFG